MLIYKNLGLLFSLSDMIRFHWSNRQYLFWSWVVTHYLMQRFLPITRWKIVFLARTSIIPRRSICYHLKLLFLLLLPGSCIFQLTILVSLLQNTFDCLFHRGLKRSMIQRHYLRCCWHLFDWFFVMSFVSCFEGSMRNFLLRLSRNVMLVIRVGYMSDKWTGLWEIVGSEENWLSMPKFRPLHQIVFLW